MSSTSRAGSALGAVAAGSAAGGALICVVLAAGHGMERGVDSTFADIALASAALGLAAAFFCGFALARPLGMMRALLAGIISVSGAALVAALTPVADVTAGRVGLLALLLLCLALGALGVRSRPRITAA